MLYEKDRRRLLRVEVKWPATIFTSHGQTHGETKSISQAGVSIYCRELPPMGRECRLEIQPPNYRPIKVSAKPIWALETGLMEGPSGFIVGTEFEYISEDDVHYLGDVIADRQGKSNKYKSLI